jgi:hypothetical protein
MSAENITKAIGAFERALLTPSRFDAYLAGNIDAATPMARAGLDQHGLHRLPPGGWVGRERVPQIWGGRGLREGDEQRDDRQGRFDIT